MEPFFTLTFVIELQSSADGSSRSIKTTWSKELLERAIGQVNDSEISANQSWSICSRRYC